MVEIFASKTAEIEEREVLHADISRKLQGMYGTSGKRRAYQFIQKSALFGNGARATTKAVLDREM